MRQSREWQRTRSVLGFLFNANVEPRSQIRNLNKWMPLLADEPEEQQERESLEEQIKREQAFLNDLNAKFKERQSAQQNNVQENEM